MQMLAVPQLLSAQFRSETPNSLSLFLNAQGFSLSYFLLCQGFPNCELWLTGKPRRGATESLKNKKIKTHHPIQCIESSNH